MKLTRTIAECRKVRPDLAGPVGFVPTMGFLHEGHLSLVRMARTACESVAVSIFVNPTQFAPSEDLSTYPRDLERDLELLEKEGVDVVLAPASNEDFYPPTHNTWIDVAGITGKLEGASRPTHFRGVATIVTKLFHVIKPDIAYFGQKDAQQALVIRQLIRDLNLDIRLAIGPIVREADGLAMSSRNTYLSPAERAAAPALRRSLDLAEELYARGERSAERLRHAMMEVLEAETLIQPEYVSIAALETLDELASIEDRALVSLAARLGGTRLIDNTVLPPGERLIEE